LKKNEIGEAVIFLHFSQLLVSRRQGFVPCFAEVVFLCLDSSKQVRQGRPSTANIDAWEVYHYQ